jgi:hypothetical protein
MAQAVGGQQVFAKPLTKVNSNLTKRTLANAKCFSECV